MKVKAFFVPGAENLPSRNVGDTSTELKGRSHKGSSHMPIFRQGGAPVAKTLPTDRKASAPRSKLSVHIF